MLEDSNFDLGYVRLCELDTPREKMVELFANSGDPDQTPRSTASDQDLHCLPINFSDHNGLSLVNEKLTKFSEQSICLLVQN